MKKSIYLLILLIISSPVIALVLSVISTGELLTIQADFSKDIPIAPSAASQIQELLDNKDIENSIEIEGFYSVKYVTDFLMFSISDGPLTFKNLHSTQVYRNINPLTTTDNNDFKANVGMLQANADYISEVQILGEPFPLYSVVISGPIKINSDKHRGNIHVSDIAVPTTPEKEKSAISFADINFTSSVPIYANLQPYDGGKGVMIRPMNDFKITLTNNTNQTAVIFNGQMRMMDSRDSYYILTRPWQSKLEGQSNFLIYSVLGDQSEITIEGQPLNYVKLFGFNGKNIIINDEAVQEKANANWNITEVNFSEIKLKLNNPAPSKFSIDLHFKGKAKKLLIDETNFQGFYGNFKNNLLLIWDNSIFQGIFLLILGVIIGSWYKETKS